MLLHEIELHSTNPDESKKFYRDVLGLPLSHTEGQLSVFRCTPAGLDLNTSAHFSEKISLSFFVKDIQATAQRLRDKGCTFTGPEKTHLDMQEIVMHDPDGNRIAIHAAGDQSPDWLKKMAREG